MTDQRAGGIAWTEETWNPLRGCSIVSAECTNCYAMARAHQYDKPGLPYDGLTKVVNGKALWNGVVRTVDHKMTEPLQWQRSRMIFVNSMSDLFHESVSFETVMRVYGIMALARQHTFQVLTKRAERLVEFYEYIEAQPRTPLALCIAGALIGNPEIANKKTNEAIMSGIGWPLPNVWVGVSVGNRQAKKRIDSLRRVPAAVRWLSIEPQIEDLGALNLEEIQWVVQGGESAHHDVCRPFEANWVADVMKQCRDQDVAYFFKQAGSKPVDFPGIQTKKGDDPREWPSGFRVRQFPEVKR